MSTQSSLTCFPSSALTSKLVISGNAISTAAAVVVSVTCGISRGGVLGDQLEFDSARVSSGDYDFGLVEDVFTLVGAIVVAHRQRCRIAAVEHPDQLDSVLVERLGGEAAGDDYRGRNSRDGGRGGGGDRDVRISRGAVSRRSA